MPPRRHGLVIASGVLAFVQATLVVIASLYVYVFASLAPVVGEDASPGLDVDAVGIEGTVLAAVQVLSAIVLVGAGVVALNRRSTGAWQLLLGAHALQLALAVYWWIRLVVLADELAGAGGVLIGFPLFFAAAPAVGLGLVATGAGRRWFAPEAAPAPTAA